MSATRRAPRGDPRPGAAPSASPARTSRRSGPAAARLHGRAAAVDSGLFERVVVSTDSREIADAAVASAPRCLSCASPTSSDDFVPVSAATVDALERVDPAGRRSQRYASSCPTARCAPPPT